MIKSNGAASSRQVHSNQQGLHSQLVAQVEKHLRCPHLKPIASRSLALFEQLDQQVRAHGGPVILDACCGVGQSSRLLAERFADALVIGIDKSQSRVERQLALATPPNCRIERGDLNDLWRLIADAQWPVSHHFILYPNPWPKSKHLQRRWHGGPLFPSILKIGGALELRSNWKLYLEEFAVALEVAGLNATLQPLREQGALTPFEHKYQASGQPCWQLLAQLAR